MQYNTIKKFDNLTHKYLAREHTRHRMRAGGGADSAALREEQARVAGVRRDPHVRRTHVPLVIVLQYYFKGYVHSNQDLNKMACCYSL